MGKFAGALASVTAGDFNGDGRQDLATNLAAGVGVFLGNGNGTFGGMITTGGGNNGQSIVAGDFNGDGKLDLAAGSSTASTVYVLWGSGSGTITSTST